MRILTQIATLTITFHFADGAANWNNEPPCPPRAASPGEQLRFWNYYVDVFFRQANYTKALTDYVWLDYIKYNPRAGQGRDAAIAALGSGDPNHNTTIVYRILVDSIGYVHHYEFAGSKPFKVVDIFQMNGSCIVEHWDIIANLTLGEINPTPLSA